MQLPIKKSRLNLNRNSESQQENSLENKEETKVYIKLNFLVYLIHYLMNISHSLHKYAINYYELKY